MRATKHLRLLGAATFLSVSALAVMAQTTPPAPSSPPADNAPMNKPGPTTAPSPQTAPAPQSSPRASAKPTAHPMVGRNALSSDGSKVGDIRAVKTGPDGKPTAILLKVGGFLGFGGKIVEVPEGKFSQKGDTIVLGYTSEELSNLPEVKDAS